MPVYRVVLFCHAALSEALSDRPSAIGRETWSPNQEPLIFLLAFFPYRVVDARRPGATAIPHPKTCKPCFNNAKSQFASPTPAPTHKKARPEASNPNPQPHESNKPARGQGRPSEFFQSLGAENVVYISLEGHNLSKQEGLEGSLKGLRMDLGVRRGFW